MKFSSLRRRPPASRSGFMLVELVVASAIALLLSLSLLGGLMHCRRVAAESTARLQADALAWDILWRTFNMDYDEIAFPTYTEEELKKMAPGLEEPVVATSIAMVDDSGRSLNGKRLKINVLWRNGGHDHALAPTLETSRYQLFRGNSSRTLL